MYYRSIFETTSETDAALLILEKGKVEPVMNDRHKSQGKVIFFLLFNYYFFGGCLIFSTLLPIIVHTRTDIKGWQHKFMGGVQP
jgi:hypothetical protein